MRDDSAEERGMTAVPQPVLRREPLHHARERRIVHVRHLREEVVLDLEIQASDEPGEDRARTPEVDGGGDLMDAPLSELLPALVGTSADTP